jgi:hypothetical protein
MRFATVLLAVAIALAGRACAEKIYVFFPSMTKPNAVQNALQARCSGNDVTVFGRLADFTAMVAQVPPDAIVAPRPLVEQFSGYKLFLRGTRKGSTSEDAVLVSAKPVAEGDLATLNVGVVGILERSAMNGFVQGVLGSVPRLKIVTKVEDLLPLLTFGSADAILVGESQVDEIKGRSQAALQMTSGLGKVPLVVAAAKGESDKIESCLKGLGASEKKMLGVDGWTK